MSNHCSAHIVYQWIGFYCIFALHNIPFGFKIFSITDLYQFFINYKMQQLYLFLQQ